METLIINGGKVLQGCVEINGAKNAAVAVLPAAILAGEGKCIIDNIPDITMMIIIVLNTWQKL